MTVIDKSENTAVVMFAFKVNLINWVNRKIGYGTYERLFEGKGYMCERLQAMICLGKKNKLS